MRGRRKSVTTTYYLNAPMSVVMASLPLNPHVLVCDWAWDKLKPSPIRRIRAWGKGRTLADVRRFTEQVRTHDLLILNGGDTPTLIDALIRNPEWIHHLEGKTVLAYSAGISAIARYSYNRDGHGILKGLGLIPYQTIVHMVWDNLKDCEAYEELEETRPHIVTCAISDDEYYKIEV